MIQCKRCGLSKPETEFYRKRAGQEARQSRCKVCDNQRRKQWRQRDLKAARRVERQRYQTCPSKTITPDQRERNRLRSRQGCVTYKPLRDAHSAVRVACRRAEQWASNLRRLHRQGGLLFRPPHCPWCGKQSPLPIEVHHYLGHARQHWLSETIWVCRQCHRHIEVLMREAELDGSPAIEGFKQFLRNHGVQAKTKTRRDYQDLATGGI